MNQSNHINNDVERMCNKLGDTKCLQQLADNKRKAAILEQGNSLLKKKREFGLSQKFKITPNPKLNLDMV